MVPLDVAVAAEVDSVDRARRKCSVPWDTHSADAQCRDDFPARL